MSMGLTSCVASTLCAGTLAHAQMSFQGIGALSPGDIQSWAIGVSADGKSVVGWGLDGDGESHPVVWTKEQGIRAIPVQGMGVGSSATGEFICGAGSEDGFSWQAFRWSDQTGFLGLGMLPGGLTSGASALSHDGSVIAGTSQDKNSEEAFRWTDSGGMQALGDLPGGGFLSRCRGISSDGKVIVGQSEVGPSSFEAFRWTEEEGMIGLGSLDDPQYPTSDPSDASADGSVIVGTSGTITGQAAFRWTAQGGMVSLAGPDGPNSSYASAVSADGSVIVGGYWAPEMRFFVWDELHGMRDLQALLETKLDLMGWTFLEASDISADGLTIVGEGVNPDGNYEGWIATIPAPAAGLLLGVWGFGMFRRRRGRSLARARREDGSIVTGC